MDNDNPPCAECSPRGMIEEEAYWAWREAAESAGYLPEDYEDYEDYEVPELSR